jgi:hypothetical protein
MRFKPLYSMTDGEVLALIESINNQTHQDSIFLVPIGERVYSARVWTPLSSTGSLSTYPSLMDLDFYFIESEREKIIGAVLDMGPSNLHWIVNQAHRGKGYMSTALREWILPHLFHDRKRKSQRITFDSAATEECTRASLQLAKAVGFKKVNGAYLLQRRNVKNSYLHITPAARSVDHERLQEISRKAMYAFDLLESISDEMQASFGRVGTLPTITKKRHSIKIQIFDAAYQK